MHEAAIAQAIIKRAIAALAQSLDERSNVVRIVVQIGEFRNVDPESLEFAFGSLRKDYRGLEMAELELQAIEALACCSAGKHEYRPRAEHYYACTICGGGIEKLISGEELNITSIEVEDSEKCTAGNR